MPETEREALAIAVARVEERVIAIGARVSRVEAMFGVVAIAVVGAIVTAIAKAL